MRLADGRLGCDSLGNVARNLRGSNDPPGEIPNGRNGQGYVDARAVFPYANRFEVVHWLAGTDTGEHLLLFEEALRRNDELDRAANGLGGLPPEHPFGRRIP